MGNSVKLSRKHGVNPTIPVCFFCGEDKREIALLGKLPGDVEAPMRMVLDYVPCEECKKRFEGGILLIGVMPNQPEDGRMAIAPGAYPAGNYVVASETFVRRIGTGESVERAIERGVCLIDHQLLSRMQEDYEKAFG